MQPSYVIIMVLFIIAIVIGCGFFCIVNCIGWDALMWRQRREAAASAG